MNRQQEIGLLKRLLHYVDTRTTALADAPWRNDVSVYTDPEHSPASNKSYSASIRS